MLAVALLLVEKLAERGEMPLTDEGSAKSAFSEIEMEYGLDWPTVRRKVFASVRDGRIYPKDWVLIKIAEALGQPDTPEFFPVLIQGIYECDHSVKSCLQSGVSEDPEHCRLQDKLVALTNRADELRAALDAVELEIAGNKRTAHEIRVRQGVRRSELALLQSVVNRRGYQAVRKAIELNPSEATAYNNLVMLLRLKNRIEDAVPLLEKVIEINPEDFNPYLALASINKQLGTHISVSGTTIAQCKNFIGRPSGKLVLKGKTDAVVAYEPLTAEQMVQPYVMEYLSAYALMEAEDPAANNAFQKLATKYPEDPLASYHAKRLAAGARSDIVIMTSK